MNPSPGGTLSVITVDGTPADGEKGLFSAARRAAAHVGVLDAGVLAGNLSAVCDQLGQLVAAAETTRGGYELESFEVSLDVSATGEVRMIGSVSSEIRGGITLTFRRRG
ncbi:hypothetical protein QEZ54_21705 [Catellatospora sp. KI3]|uniref:Pepco domain-containing protein n=1 Tax=Catellatospora sp. KI3 TaxID=3041620 RepID=UPI0024832761|nr:hypothetical protein [Catellatospora sp. KI3]MDI1463603.1 hypothetical protein [Catellatospora sp. KI3]